MAHILIKMFREITQAQHAREALLANGFVPENVQLDVSEDEAGPTAGNFVLDRKDTPAGAAAGVDAPPGERDPRVNSQAILRGHYIMTIDIADATRLDHAADIVQRYGAEDPGGRTFGR